MPHRVNRRAVPAPPRRSSPAVVAPVTAAAPPAAPLSSPPGGAPPPPEAQPPEAQPQGSVSQAFPNGLTSMADITRLAARPDRRTAGPETALRHSGRAAARALSQVGVIDSDEGGLPPWSLAHQDAGLIKAALAGNRGALVSRWGHILLRRALASRLDAPAGMDPAEFVADRAALLVRMGEGDAARALVQDVDPAEYTPPLIDAAVRRLTSPRADLTGICPVIALHGAVRQDGQWQVLTAICTAFSGDGAGGMAQARSSHPGRRHAAFRHAAGAEICRRGRQGAARGDDRLGRRVGHDALALLRWRSPPGSIRPPN